MTTVEVATTPRGRAWVPALHELAADIDAGRVYARDLPALLDALTAVDAALDRRRRR